MENCKKCLKQVNKPPNSNDPCTDEALTKICRKYVGAPDVPWIHLNPRMPPPSQNKQYKQGNPYDDKNKQCKTQSKLITFTKITREKHGYEFYQPVRNRSKIFQHNGDDNGYGCVRDDIMNVDSGYYKLNCNTNTSFSINRDKYRMINYIIKHSTELNTSDRTKLALMDEEELINKAQQLTKFNIQKLNDYTRPKLVTNVVDIWNESEKKYQIWDDLQRQYLGSSKKPKLGLKTWDYVGCSQDFNDSDKSPSFKSCKDKYPGLCRNNKHKCDNKDDEGAQMRIDCPETCNVQFKNLDTFKDQQEGDLSICTSLGRCKWPNDQDPSNLLPLCSKKSSRTSGNNKKCQKFKSKSIHD